MITRIGSTIGSSVEGAIPSVAVALNRPTSSFVMYALSAQGRGGMSSTAIRCWRFAVRSITAPLTGYLNVINSVCKKRKNHRMLLYNFRILPHSNYPSAYQMVKDILKEFKIDKPTRS